MSLSLQFQGKPGVELSLARERGSSFVFVNIILIATTQSSLFTIVSQVNIHCVTSHAVLVALYPRNSKKKETNPAINSHHLPSQTRQPLILLAHV